MTVLTGNLNAYEMGAYLATQDPFDRWDEPQYGDRDYDYGYADDGWPIPPPCIIDGTPMNACTADPGYGYHTHYGVGGFGA